MKRLLVGILFAFTLAGCGKGLLDATYSGPRGATLVFKPNGKVIFLGAMEMDYEVDGQDIKLTSPGQGTLVLKMLDDGSIQYPILGTYKRVSK